jgi:uncharacterized protein with ParB-like and HNH nuclease domain
MKNFDTRVYNVSDFVEWNNRDQLQLSPDFQRRSVWSLQAKSYLVDTVIRGKPMPKLFIAQDVKDRRNIRTVVDGQQRLRSLLEYIENDRHRCDMPERRKISAARDNFIAQIESL